MPYINKENRENLDKSIDELIDNVIVDELEHASGLPGILNYTITRLVLGTYEKTYEKLRYAHINNIIGILECAKLEMYRRVAGPYEDIVSIKNGDLQEFEEWGD